MINPGGYGPALWLARSAAIRAANSVFRAARTRMARAMKSRASSPSSGGDRLHVAGHAAPRVGLASAPQKAAACHPVGRFGPNCGDARCGVRIQPVRAKAVGAGDDRSTERGARGTAHPSPCPLS